MQREEQVARHKAAARVWRRAIWRRFGQPNLRSLADDWSLPTVSRRYNQCIIFQWSLKEQLNRRQRGERRLLIKPSYLRKREVARRRANGGGGQRPRRL